MGDFEEGCGLLDKMFGGGKDNVIALATVALEPGSGGNPRPAVRAVNAYYADGTFYVTTNRRSDKMRQIESNGQVSIASSAEMFTANGIAENLGWVRDPRNAELRGELRAAFSSWYDSANDEDDEDCCIMAIRLADAVLNINHWERIIRMDFVARR